MPQSTTHPAGTDSDTIAGLSLLPSLDLIHAEELLGALQAQLGSGGDLRVEAASVTRISTACMQVLVAAAFAARRRGCGFVITDASSALCSATRDLGLAAILGIGAADSPSFAGDGVMVKRVMVVDDSRTMRDMVAFTLRSAGFEISLAEDGKKAIDLLAASPVDVIVTDLNMPVMNGVALIRAVRADPKWRAVPILMLTTESEATKKAEGREAGATGWLVKPFNPEKLVETVKRVCG